MGSLYLVCGDDDAKIDAWRARVRKRAEQERGPGGLELFDAREAEPAAVASALSTLTFDTGSRYLLVEDAGAWKAGALGELEEGLTQMPPDMVLVLVVRGKPAARLTKAVEKAGGEVRECPAPKPWELPKWIVERARELGLQTDVETAKGLVALVGGSQQRLSRELEKLALALHPSTRLDPEAVEQLAAGDAAPQAYELADALVAGDLRSSLALAQELETHGERPGRLVYTLARRLREVHRAARLLDAGVPDQKAGQALGMPPWLAKRTLARAKKSDPASLERSMCVLADLEVELRGGGDHALDEDTAFSLALARATR
ncbi:MAG: DNA polymerase III subunit delta [Thermoleophilaceae bacterium]